jgi:hypothetical protein
MPDLDPVMVPAEQTDTMHDINTVAIDIRWTCRISILLSEINDLLHVGRFGFLHSAT